MSGKKCSLCSYLDVEPFIFEWDNGCPICGAEKDFIEEEEVTEEDYSD